ncbi:MAG: hypothetical protein ACOYJB_03945 [Christensenellaceae bacterium]
MKNFELRKLAHECGVKLWEIADYLGISEPTMTRLLRHELPEQKRQELIAAIDQIRREKSC